MKERSLISTFNRPWLMEKIREDDDSIFPETEVEFANFWPRFGALLIDGIITALFTVPITYLNVIHWKTPALFILTSLITIVYKPLMEYKFGATLGKMALGILVVGNEFRQVTLKEELSRVSFYLIPGIVSEIITLNFYFSGKFKMISGIQEYNDYITSSNPALFWLNGIVFALLVADSLTFLTNPQSRSLHDIYAGTYVVKKPLTTNSY